MRQNNVVYGDPPMIILSIMQFFDNLSGAVLTTQTIYKWFLLFDEGCNEYI